VEVEISRLGGVVNKLETGVNTIKERGGECIEFVDELSFPLEMAECALQSRPSRLARVWGSILPVADERMPPRLGSAGASDPQSACGIRPVAVGFSSAAFTQIKVVWSGY
jgi:hypothetical protein